MELPPGEFASPGGYFRRAYFVGQIHHALDHACLADLSAKSVLFLDELPEFNRRTLEVLRQPLEEGMVTISRALRSTTFPAEFILVATMNTCPYGYRDVFRKLFVV